MATDRVVLSTSPARDSAILQIYFTFEDTHDIACVLSSSLKGQILDCQMVSFKLNDHLATARV